MAKIQSTLAHRYGQTVSFPFGDAKFDHNGTAEVADSDALRLGAQSTTSGYVVVDENAPDAGPKTRAQVQAELEALTVPVLQQKLRLLEVPEVEWMHLRKKADLVSFILTQLPADAEPSAE